VDWGEVINKTAPAFLLAAALSLEMVKFTAAILLSFVGIVYSPRCEAPFFRANAALQWNVICPALVISISR
jgi:hypothetical protein